MGKIRLPAEMENLEGFLDFVVKEAGGTGLPAGRISEIRLAAEEVLVNIFCYAYPETQGDVSINCSGGEDAFVLEILDRGAPFDITKAPGPDLSSCLSDRSVGGLGIYFVNKMATEARYDRKNGQNRLKLVFAKYRQE